MKPILIAALAFVLAGTAPQFAADEKQSESKPAGKAKSKPEKFSTKDVAAWGKNIGDWKVVAGVSSDEKNAKRLDAKEPPNL